MWHLLCFHIFSHKTLNLFSWVCHDFCCHFSCDLTALIFYVDITCHTYFCLNFNSEFTIHKFDLILKYKRSHYLVWGSNWWQLIFRAHLSEFRQFMIFLGHETCIMMRTLTPDNWGSGQPPYWLPSPTETSS